MGERSADDLGNRDWRTEGRSSSAEEAQRDPGVTVPDALRGAQNSLKRAANWMVSRLHRTSSRVPKLSYSLRSNFCLSEVRPGGVSGSERQPVLRSILCVCAKYYSSLVLQIMSPSRSAEVRHDKPAVPNKRELRAQRCHASSPQICLRRRRPVHFGEINVTIVADTLTTGGAETFIVRLATALQSRVRSVHLFVLRRDRIEPGLAKRVSSRPRR